MHISARSIYAKVIYLFFVRFISQDLYEDVDYGVLTPATKIKVKVNPSGVVILRCDIQPETRNLQFLSRRYTPYSPINDVFKIRQNSF